MAMAHVLHAITCNSSLHISFTNLIMPQLVHPWYDTTLCNPRLFYLYKRINTYLPLACWFLSYNCKRYFLHLELLLHMQRTQARCQQQASNNIYNIDTGTILIHLNMPLLGLLQSLNELIIIQTL